MKSSSQRSATEAHSAKVLGTLVVGALSGVWRSSLPRENPSQETLSLITPLLYSSGSAALGWWRIRNGELRGCSPGSEAELPVWSGAVAEGAETPKPAGMLHDAYRRSRLNALIHEQELNYILSLLGSEGIEPVLVKGWAIARRYPELALRPYGDFDLCIRPDQFKRAEAALKCLESIDRHIVDLHYGFAKLNGGRRAHRDPALACGFRAPKSATEVATLNALWHEWFDRSLLVDLGEDKVRILCDEDHLRVLCLHFVRSGAWRPLWLCDVAVAVESRGPDFNWKRCLGTDPLLADWVACTIGLAHRLLGLDLSDMPVAERARKLPRWLEPAVLRQFGRSRNPDASGMALPALARRFTKPKELLNEIYARWDQPVRAISALQGSFRKWTPLPYQFGELILRSPEVPRQLGMMLR